MPEKCDECRVAVLWIDWYPYHVARFVGLLQAPTLAGRVAGLEMVGGIGVHAGLKFREELPAALPIETLMPGESWGTANKLRLATLVWQRLSRLDPETVLVPGYYTLPAIAAAAWARLHGRKSVLMTESCSYDHPRTPWKERVKGWALRVLFGWAVAGGQDHIAYLRQLGFPRDRIGRYYDVVDNRRIEAGVGELQSGTAEAHGLPSRYFLFVGRIAPEKNVAGLLQAWLRYRMEGGSWPLVLAGDGPDLPGLRASVEGSAFAADVHFTGLKTSTELLPLFAFASCFVLPSTREPWGLVVNEAMAASLPVLLSSRCGCSADLVQEGLTGWVFDPGEGEELSRDLRRMESLADDERRRMGRAAADRVAAFSPERFGREIAWIADAPSSPVNVRQRAREAQ